MNYIEQLNELFATIATTTNALAGSYIFADYEKYHNNSKEIGFAYPLLWLDSRHLDFAAADAGNNVHSQGLQPVFFVLEAVELNNYQAETAALSRTFDIAQQVLRYLYRMRRVTGATFHFDRKNGQTNYTQIQGAGPDNAYGYRISWPLQLSLDYNLDVADYDQDILPPIMAQA